MQWQFICWKLIKFEHCQFAHWHYRSYRNVKNKSKNLSFLSSHSFTTLCPTSSLPLSLIFVHLASIFFQFQNCVPYLCSRLLHSYSNAVCQGDVLLGGESVHQWLCAGVERLESQALPAELQKGTGPLHWTAEPTVKPTAFRSCSAENSHSVHVQQLILVLYVFLGVFLIDNFGQGEVILCIISCFLLKCMINWSSWKARLWQISALSLSLSSSPSLTHYLSRSLTLSLSLL